MSDIRPARREHPQLEALPDWPVRTIAVLATVDDEPHAIPVSAPVCAGDHRVLLSLHRARASLRRLRERPEAALVVLTGGNTAFTARGRAHVVQEAMEPAPEYAAVAIDVEQIDDHRQTAFLIEAGVDRQLARRGGARCPRRARSGARRVGS